MVARGTRYAGRTASLATLHDKLGLIAPEMRDWIGLEVRTVPVDTDAFGTFTGDVARADGPLQTALAKARAGMASSGASIGLASEGSIGTNGLVPVVSDLEIVVIVDDEEGFELWESAESFDIVARGWTLDASTVDEGDLESCDFPAHGLIVRPAGGAGPIVKGIHDRRTLDEAILRCRRSGADAVRIESDLRAHHCPSRRPTIRAAARRLAERLSRSCPACRCPGWGPVDTVGGRPCRDCHHPTDGVTATVLGCSRCGERSTITRDCVPADPATCGRCNP